MIDRHHITGLVLAGGRGSRMGGLDKGLQDHQGMPLAQHALRRLQPQVGRTMISANRNLAVYQGFGVPVWPDASQDFPGPLAGLLAGLTNCPTPYLVSVPCDTPDFPTDLVQRLALALEAGKAEMAVAATFEEGRLHTQPAFCLLRTQLKGSLAQFLQSGQRKVAHWTSGHHPALATFEEPAAFFNANTADELQQLQARSTKY
jgi:molybdopterin-guanine dinucleotide biosynthesis protein A